MSYIPPGAQWYLADIVEAISVGDDPRIVVHVNTRLVRAESPEEAYAKALALGRDGATNYKNPAGEDVRIEFVGLCDLNVIHDPLEDGAELAYEELVVRSRAEAEAITHPREALGAFMPPGRDEAMPDYRSADIEAEAQALLRGRH